MNQSWRQAGLFLALLLLLTAVLYHHTLLYLGDFWNVLQNGDYAHGYLVLLVSAYLIFISRHSLSKFIPRPNYWALCMVLVFSLMWMLASLTGVLIVQAVALLLLILAIVWAMLGSQVGLKLAFPILFIIVAIPVWFPLSTLLQDMTADVVFVVVRILGIPAFQHENMIVLPAGTLSVEEACSGMRYFLAAITLGGVYAYLNYTSIRSRLIVILIAAIGGMLANVLRVFIVVYLGYTTEMQHPYIKDHMLLGWYLFGALLVVLLIFDSWLYRRRPVKTIEVEQSDEKEAAPVVVTMPQQYLLSFAAIAMLLSVGPVATYIINERQYSGTTAFELELPSAMVGWSETIAEDDSWQPYYRGAMVKKNQYTKAGSRVYLYIGFYPVQRQGEELISYFNQIYNADVWRADYTRARKATVGSKQVLEQLLINKQHAQRLVWYWYNVGGKLTTNKYEAKLLQVLGLLTGTTHSYVIAVATDKAEDIEAAKLRMQGFILALPEPRVIKVENKSR